MQRSPMEAVFKVCRSRNSGEAYRQFRSTSLVIGVHEMVIELLRRKLNGELDGRESELDFVGHTRFLPVAPGDRRPLFAFVAADELAVGGKRH